MRVTSHANSGPVRIGPDRRLCQTRSDRHPVQSVRDSHKSWTKFRGPDTYNYDGADNLTQKASTQQAFNNADQLCWTAATTGTCASPPTGATTYQYDTRGNRTNVNPSGGQAQTLAYDQASRLTKFTAAGTTSYGYNADGLRMCKYSGSSNQPCSAVGATQFLWDVAGTLSLLLKDGSTAYVYGPGGLPLEQVNTSSTYWYHHDQLGSTRLVSNSTGGTSATYTFDPYGGLASSTNPGGITNPFGFCGQYQDSESGFYYLRARYYDSQTGQFVSFDPAVSATREPYAYVVDSPLNSSDPSGLCDWWNPVCGAVDQAKFTWGLATGVWDSGKDLVQGVVELPQTVANIAQRVQECGGCAVVDILQGTLDDFGNTVDDLNSGDPQREGHAVGEVLGFVFECGYGAGGAGKVARFAREGREIRFSKDFRVAPFGNRTGHPTGRFPHYHRRGPGGIGAHRPWEGW